MKDLVKFAACALVVSAFAPASHVEAAAASDLVRVAAAPGEPNPSEKAALSRKCSIEADLRGLRGRARARFRDKCKRGNA